MIRPSLSLVAAINQELREPGEFFDDEEDFDRVERVLKETEWIGDPLRLAGALMSRLARTQAFAEGNKRTALAVAHFVLSFNGIDTEACLPPCDTTLLEHLVRAARGEDIEREVNARISGSTERDL